VNAESGFEIKPVYDAESVPENVGEPGRFPYTRGVYPTMYTKRPWTMRQYAGFGTAAESNVRYHQLLAAGTMGLSVAFDLPTQMGYDSDEPLAHGEVGKVGVAIDSIDDMRRLFDGIPLDEVSTSMTINAPASVLLLLYQLVAEEHGVPGSALQGTIQNDVLKEYIARGTYIFPPRPSLRLVADTFAYCRAEIPKWNTISISGYHMAEAGATPAQEIGFTLANGIEYVRAAIDAGLAVDDFGPRLSFFFVARTTLLEEIAKFRAARRMWARIMRDDFGATDPKSMMLRFHTDTVDPFAGSYAIEAMTDEVEAVATALIERVFGFGSVVQAIEQGFQKQEIEASAYRIANQIDNGERVVVGVNRFRVDEEEKFEPLRVDPAIEAAQVARLTALRAERDGAAVESALADLAKAAQGSQNVLPFMREALRLRATVGEVCHTLRGVWGVYHPVEHF
jgi:methylmalonyl-CoA mutase N-terminal domain/subunit